MVTRRLRRAGTLTGIELALLLSLAHGANDAFSNVLPVFLPTLQERFGLGEAVLAAFVAIISLSANVMQAFAGALADRWGRRRSAALGLVVGSVLMSFLAIAPTVWALVIILAIGGLGSALFHPAAVSMTRSAGQNKGLFVGLFTAGGPLGTALMPIVVLFIIRTFGIGYVPWLAVIGVATGVALFLFTPVQEHPERAARPKIFDPKLFRGPVGQLAAAGTLRAIAFISFVNATPLYLSNVRGFATDAAVIGFTLGLYSAAGAVGGLLAGALEPRLGRRRLIIGTMLASVPALIATLILPPGTAMYFVLVALAGLFSNASIPLLVVSAQDLAPHAVATASGMLMGFTWGTAGVLYIGIGALQEVVGLAPAMIGSFCAMIPAALLTYVVMRRNAAALS